MAEEAATFRIQIRNLDGILILDMTGIVNQQAELAFRTLMQELGDGPEYLLFNFTGVPYTNSAGFSVLLRILKQCLNYKALLFGYGLDPLQSKLYKAAGITDYISFYPDEYSILQRIHSS